MRPVAKGMVLVLAVVFLPAAAYAQASIAGQVKDVSGAVLPGVTVEAASPALIEKVRTAVTDGGGQYRVEILPPGTYSLTFTLPGFNTVKREGIQLSGTFTATIFSLDIYNTLNVDTALTLNNAFATWQRPQSNILARFAKLGMQFDF